MHKYIFVAAMAAITLFTLAPSSHAGLKWNYEVTHVTNGAFGAVGSARASSDNKQYIGCWVTSTASSAVGGCQARRSDGAVKSCSTSNASIVANMRAINEGSFIYFNYSGGACTSLQVSNYSTYRPKTP